MLPTGMVSMRCHTRTDQRPIGQGTTVRTGQQKPLSSRVTNKKFFYLELSQMLMNNEFQRFDCVESYSVCSCLLYRSTVSQASGRRANKLWKHNNNNKGQDLRSKLIIHIYIYTHTHTHIYIYITTCLYRILNAHTNLSTN